MSFDFQIQAALVIRGFAIRGFDYSRTKKQGKIADNKGNNTNLACFRLKMKVLVFADSKFLGNVTPSNSEGNLYLFAFERDSVLDMEWLYFNRRSPVHLSGKKFDI